MDVLEQQAAASSTAGIENAIVVISDAGDRNHQTGSNIGTKRRTGAFCVHHERE